MSPELNELQYVNQTSAATHPALKVRKIQLRHLDNSHGFPAKIFQHHLVFIVRFTAPRNGAKKPLLRKQRPLPGDFLFETLTVSRID